MLYSMLVYVIQHVKVKKICGILLSQYIRYPYLLRGAREGYRLLSREVV